jgi:hypothetical protein
MAAKPTLLAERFLQARLPGKVVAGGRAPEYGGWAFSGKVSGKIDFSGWGDWWQRKSINDFAFPFLTLGR